MGRAKRNLTRKSSSFSCQLSVKEKPMFNLSIGFLFLSSLKQIKSFAFHASKLGVYMQSLTLSLILPVGVQLADATSEACNYR